MVERERARLIDQWREDNRTAFELASRMVPPTAARSDLTLRQLQVLVLVRSQPGVTGHDLSGHLGVTTPTVSGLVDRLVTKGLLGRRADPEDRRRVLLTLTPAGLDVLAELESLRTELSTEVLARLSMTELESLVAVTARLRQIVEQLVTERRA